MILSGEEVREWLREEPDYSKSIVEGSSDDSYHENSSDDNLNRTLEDLVASC
jgi:hypothetical protein